MDKPGSGKRKYRESKRKFCGTPKNKIWNGINVEIRDDNIGHVGVGTARK